MSEVSTITEGFAGRGIKSMEWENPSAARAFIIYQGLMLMTFITAFRTAQVSFFINKFPIDDKKGILKFPFRFFCGFFLRLQAVHSVALPLALAFGILFSSSRSFGSDFLGFGFVPLGLVVGQEMACPPAADHPHAQAEDEAPGVFRKVLNVFCQPGDQQYGEAGENLEERGHCASLLLGLIVGWFAGYFACRTCQVIARSLSDRRSHSRPGKSRDHGGADSI